MFKTDFSKKILKITGLTVLVLIFQAMIIFYLVNFINKSVAEVEEKNWPLIENILPTEENLYYAIKQIESLGNRTGNQTVIEIISPSAVFDSGIGANYVSYRARLDR